MQGELAQVQWVSLQMQGASFPLHPLPPCPNPNLHYTVLSWPLGEKVVSFRLLVPTRIANLTRITDKMPTTKNSVVLVADCIC